MMKKIFLILISFTTILFSQPEFTELSSRTGAFSRVGFGARGIGMGNAFTAVTSGNLVSYYNPAVTVFQNGNVFQTSYSFLSLDRSLNFLSFTRKFDFYSSRDTAKVDRKPVSTAGISVGIINSGVSKIDGRDNNGLKTEELSTSENQFFLSVANRFSEKLSIGVSAKFYYYSLYEEISATGVSIDLGGLFKFNEQWQVGVVITDINGKYTWDSSPVYEREGVIVREQFPLLKKIGVSYTRSDLGLLAAVEFENSDAGTNIIRAGAEYNIYEGLFLRAGIDQFNLSNSDFPAKPSAGFSYVKKIDNFIFGVDYAFQMEQYSPYDRHIIGVNFRF